MDSKQMKTLLEAIRPTTFVESSKLRDHLGLDITVATETFQHTGSFKFRAAYNVALNVPNEEIIGVSSGNFGQALAYACKLLGKKCTVVMPHNSAQVKVDAVRSFGATADLIDVNKISRVERLEQLATERPDAYLASAYDDQFVIDGNSTLGDELAERNFDAVILPIGGGGLISGTIQSFGRNGVNTWIYGAEPIMANDAARSLRAGYVVANESEPQTIADGTRTLSVGKLNWPIIKDGVADIIEVSEEKIIAGVRMYFALANLKVEPTAALSLGAVLERYELFSGKKICTVVSGGNVDAEVYGTILMQKPAIAPLQQTSRD
jgi:threonine dehydratase